MIHKLAVAVVGALLVLRLSPAGAQSDHVPTPEEFINRAAVSGLYEVEASRIALAKGHHAELKGFAQTMVNDHTAAGEELKAVAGDFPMPEALDSAHQELIAELNTARPGDFDRVYWVQQSAAHKDAISLFTKYASQGENGAVKGFAAKTLPILQHHQEMLGALETTLAP
jgi:putative membrane protein